MSDIIFKSTLHSGLAGRHPSTRPGLRAEMVGATTVNKHERWERDKGSSLCAVGEVELGA